MLIKSFEVVMNIKLHSQKKPIGMSDLGQRPLVSGGRPNFLTQDATGPPDSKAPL